MNKNVIKKYAVWARNELIERVSQKALQYGIVSQVAGQTGELAHTDARTFGERPQRGDSRVGVTADYNAASVNGKLLSETEIKQRQALIRKVNEQGYEQTMEEVAYTWFNRFAALRFMEVNGYLPSHVRVFTNNDGEFKPQILSEAIHLEVDGLNMDKVYELKNANKNEELFKYLIITQCNALSSILPGMFQKIADYTELLLPDYLLREGSVIEQMVNQKDGIPESDWTDQVQIIGWLYQYYNTEPKDKIFADLKKNIKITKDTIPAATQLFTPDWIVHYMVENSLGRLWLEGHPNDSLKSEWKYYLDEAEQEPDVEKQLEEIRKEYAGLKPEEIRCIDPCMGSGHILCVLFDTLVRIYEDYGYTAREAAASIVENNLWGLDIDERAAQLAYFAVMMKARQYDRRFFTRGIQPHVYAIEESNGLRYDGDYGDFLLDKEQQDTLNYLFEAFKDAKEYGSILHVEQRDYDGFLKGWKLTAEATFENIRIIGWYIYAGDKVVALANQAKALSQKYHVVVTNPPYMGNKGMDAKIAEYVQKNYFDEKLDLFAVFIRVANNLLKRFGFQAMITQHSWMFLQSFNALRVNIIDANQVKNMAHLGARAFDEIGGEVVQTTAFVLQKERVKGHRGLYVRLVDVQGEKEKSEAFFYQDNRYTIENEKFIKVPNQPVVYWLGNTILSLFSEMKALGDMYETKLGMSTNDNNRFLRFWYEVSDQNTCYTRKNGDEKKYEQKWFPYSKGGSYRKWYGNVEYVINWFDDGAEVKKLASDLYGSYSRTCKNTQHFFKSALTWGLITPGAYSCRYLSEGCVLGDAGPVCFAGDDTFLLLAYLNSCIVSKILPAINPTINCSTGVISTVPLFDEIKIKEYREEIISLSKRNISSAREDWNESETSWGFEIHPLIGECHKLKDAYSRWEDMCDTRFFQMQKDEERINEIFIEIDGLKAEESPKADPQFISVKRASIQRDVKSLISYAVGCMFGRYSLDVPGLAYAGGAWDASKYTTFQPDKDAIIPICDDEYFEDDIVGRFVEFVKVVYGDDTLEENLRFVADALKADNSKLKTATSREVIRHYFINEFYKEHCKIYQKRPIYWLFDSGKKNGFKCLVYMHRYQPDTIARIRTDYVHEQQSRYRTAIADLEQRINGASTSERVKLNKQLTTLQAQIDEIRTYEEKIHHLADQMIRIDLDDGVKHNYEIFKDVLAKIK